jgi:hypothetical protein
MDLAKIFEQRPRAAFRETKPRSGRREAVIIESGWGSSGYYGEDVLGEFGPKAWPPGTHMHLDHPTFSEDIERPEGSIKDWVGVVATEPRMVRKSLVAEVDVFDHWKPVIENIAPHVGLSVIAPGLFESGAAGGKEGPICKEIHPSPINRVDYVTVAGAGGKLGTLIESARANATGEHEEEEDVKKLLREADDEKLQVFIDSAIALKESRSTPSGGNQDKETEMETEDLQRQLSEAKDQLAKKDEEITGLKETVDEEKSRGDRAEDALLISGASTIAREVADRVEGMPDRARKRVVESAVKSLPKKEDGTLDAERVRENAKKAAKEELEYLAGQSLDGDLPFRESGNGDVTVTTTTANGGEVSQEQLVEAFKASGMDEEAAKIAAEGR